jgi:ammonia channel protein AmtB
LIYTFESEVDGQVAGPKLLLIQLLGLVSIVSWSGILSYIYFKASMKMNMMRFKKIDEILGGDLHYFGPIKFVGNL